MLVTPNIEALDEFLSITKEGATTAKKSVAMKGMQKKEMDYWHTWNNGGRKPNDLKPLYDSYKPLIQKTAIKFVNRVEIPTSAIHSELRKQFVNAVKTYDPSRGTQLNSWVTTNLQKTSRFVKTYQNIGKIPEGNIAKITEYKQGRTELRDRLGHEPDSKTLADHLKWPHKKVVQIGKELREDNPVSGFLHDPAENLTSKELEAVHLVQYDHRLGPDDRIVYEHVFGINGKTRLGPGEIAKKTGLHPSKVSRIRTKLKGLITEAIEVL